MPINAHPEYMAAQKEYLMAQTQEEKIEKLKKMISVAPKHKGGENLRAQLRARLKKFLEQQEKSKKARKGKQGIKKEDMQAVIVGLTNSGKSSLLSQLTNASPEINPYHFATKNPVIGIMKYSGVNIQIIEVPPVKSEFYDRGLVNSADSIILLVNSLEQINEIEEELQSSVGKKIIVFNVMDKNTDLRKLEATMKTRKIEPLIINTETGEGLEQLKEKIFKSFGKIRIFTKEPGKDKSEKPFIFNPSTTVKNVAEKIFKTTTKVKETRIWGPSSKFPGQIVGLNHGLKDLDVIEFKTH
ncbi:MAG: GTPase [Candidatus Pacearchaeota archaeon]|jgi:ribosome-interacting GTPase 1